LTDLKMSMHQWS